MASAIADGVKRPASLGSSPGRTHSARIVPLRNIAEEVRSQSTMMQTVRVPGVGRPLLRRHARDAAAGLSAYVQRTAATGRFDQLSVSLHAGGTLVSTVLRGHKSDIVDIEFLRAARPARTFVLGSCDVDGVVFLWFLRRVDDPAAPARPRELATLRSYSFFSLRRSKLAYYNRIRLAGAANSGTMVLCPNDGSDVRVIQFHCMPDPNGGADIPVIAPPPPRQQVKVSADRGLMESAHKPEAPATADRGIPAPAVAVAAAAAVGGAAVAGAALAAKEDSEEEAEEEVVEDEEEEEVEDVAEGLEEGGEEERGDDREGEEPAVQGARKVFDRGEVEKNRTFPLTMDEEGEVDVDDDIARATARAAGIEEEEGEEEEEEEEEEEAVEGEYEEVGADDDEEDYGDEYEDEEEPEGEYEEGEPGEDEEYEDEYSDEEYDDKAEQVDDEEPGRPAQRRTA